MGRLVAAVEQVRTMPSRVATPPGEGKLKNAFLGIPARNGWAGLHFRRARRRAACVARRIPGEPSSAGP